MIQTVSVRVRGNVRRMAVRTTTTRASVHLSYRGVPASHLKAIVRDEDPRAGPGLHLAARILKQIHL